MARARCCLKHVRQRATHAHHLGAQDTRLRIRTESCFGAGRMQGRRVLNVSAVMHRPAVAAVSKAHQDVTCSSDAIRAKLGAWAAAELSGAHASARPEAGQPLLASMQSLSSTLDYSVQPSSPPTYHHHRVGSHTFTPTMRRASPTVTTRWGLPCNPLHSMQGVIPASVGP